MKEDHRSYTHIRSELKFDKILTKINSTIESQEEFATRGDGWNSSYFTVPSFFPPGWGWRSPLWFNLGIVAFFHTLCAETLFPIYFEPKPNRPLALRGHVTNASFKQWVGILVMPKIDRAHKNYLTPEIWEETHLREIFYTFFNKVAWFVLAAMLEGILLPSNMAV